MSTIDSNAMLGEESSTSVENAETISTRDSLESAYDQLESKPEEVEVAAEAPAEPDAEPEVTEEKPVEDTKPEDANVSKAPRMWGPAAREKFAALPEDVQQEVTKREREIDAKLRETASERQIADLTQKTLSPHLEYLREIGIAPFQAVSEMLTLGRKLHSGTNSEKAAVIAQLTTQYKVDIAELEDHLVKSINRPAAPPEVIAMETRLRQLETQNTQVTNQAANTHNQAMNAEIEAFVKDPKNEFIQDVWQDMTHLLNTGKAADLSSAYKTACRMNDQVFQTQQSRTAQQADRVKAGTASMKSQGPRTTSSAKAQPKTARAALEAAWDEAVGE